MMSKENKKNYIEEMKKVFSSSEAVMIAQYQGLNVKELDTLRKELREKGILFKITKNALFGHFKSNPFWAVVPINNKTNPINPKLINS